MSWAPGPLVISIKPDPTGTTDQDLNNVVGVPDTCGEEEKMETPQAERKRQKWPGGL